MSVEWYYTTNKQQMGPVSWNELRDLADVGILKPHDLVWAEGMDEWVKAINQNGLFAEDDQAKTATTTTKKASYAEPKPPPGRRTRRAEDDEDEDDVDEKEEKRQSRKRKQERAQMAVGVKVALILAAVLFLLLLIGCAGGLLVMWGMGGFGAGGGPGRHDYTIGHLNPRASNERRFDFQQGRRVIITANSTTQMPNTDVDLYVFRANNNQVPVALDENLSSNSRIDFIVPENGSFRVVILNRGPGFASSTRVSVEVK